MWAHSVMTAAYRPREGAWGCSLPCRFLSLGLLALRAVSHPSWSAGPWAVALILDGSSSSSWDHCPGRWLSACGIVVSWPLVQTLEPPGGLGETRIPGLPQELRTEKVWLVWEVKFLQVPSGVGASGVEPHLRTTEQCVEGFQTRPQETWGQGVGATTQLRKSF